MRLFTALTCAFLLAAAPLAAQELTYSFNPAPSADLSAPFGIYVQNGARGLSGPWDLDKDDKMELLVTQHSGAGGRVHVLENTGPNTWELVYSTAVIDSSASSNNARYAIGADLDNDGNWEIVTIQGNTYKAATKQDSVAAVGAYIWEHDGVMGSDNYGAKPASIASFYDLDGFTSVAYLYAQVLVAEDVDGDGQQELLIPAQGPSSADLFYVMSVTGNYQSGGVGTTFETWANEFVVGPRLNSNLLGGGSPIALYAADLNGDNATDLSFHTWNNFLLFNGTSTGANSYAVPGANAANRFLKVNPLPRDEHALFGGVVYDIDSDGNDEIFYANYYDNKVYAVDYAQDEDVLEIEASNVSTDADAIAMGGAGGVTVGDLDNDGQPEIMVGGGGYTGSQYDSGQPSQFIRLAEYNGGDPKVDASYTHYVLNTGTPADSAGFHLVYRDSLGTTSQYHVIAQSKQGSTTIASDPLFPSNIVYLGDVDGNGTREVALSFQGVDDSLSVYDEVWTNFPTGSATGADTSYYVRTVRSTVLNPNRDFVRVYSFSENFALAGEGRVVLPTDYVLSGNYPNPFSNETTIRFTLPVAKEITAKVYDVQGRLVNTLVSGELYAPGPHELGWDGTTGSGTPVASGVYLFRLEYGNFSQSMSITLVR